MQIAAGTVDRRLATARPALLRRRFQELVPQTDTKLILTVNPDQDVTDFRHCHVFDDIPANTDTTGDGDV